MKKYYPIWSIVALGVRGVIVLAFCLLGGIWLAHGLGSLFDCWGAESNYFSDFLGGALGLTVGFILDKSCIEKINQVFKYKALMKIVKNELFNIKKIVFYKVEKEKKIELSTEICKKDKKDEKGENYNDMIVKGNAESENCMFSFEELVNEDNIKFEGNKEFILQYENISYPIYELIFDDIVKNAETVSILANLPFAGEYNDKLINNLGMIHKYVVEYNEIASETSEAGKTDKCIKKWLCLQYYINLVIEVL